MDEGEARRRLSDARVGRLATADARAKPHVVPIVFAVVGDIAYSVVDFKPKRHPRLKRLDNIRATGRASLLVDGYDEDWARLWWVRADAAAEVLDVADPETASALTALKNKYPQYAATPPVGPVIALRIDGWRFWSATD
jgi:PPOX class probable F420-dependent enzyme